MGNNPVLRGAHDYSLFPVLSTGEIPWEKPAWHQLWNSFNRIHGCRSTGWPKIISVNLVSREPHVLVSSYRFNACRIPWKCTMLRSIFHESQTDCVGLSQILQNLMDLPSYISELTELHAVWLQPPLQTPHPSCVQYSCGIFNRVSLLFPLRLELGVSEAETIHHQL